MLVIIISPGREGSGKPTQIHRLTRAITVRKWSISYGFKPACPATETSKKNEILLVASLDRYFPKRE